MYDKRANDTPRCSLLAARCAAGSSLLVHAAFVIVAFAVLLLPAPASAGYFFDEMRRNTSGGIPPTDGVVVPDGGTAYACDDDIWTYSYANEIVDQDAFTIKFFEPKGNGSAGGRLFKENTVTYFVGPGSPGNVNCWVNSLDNIDHCFTTGFNFTYATIALDADITSQPTGTWLVEGYENNAATPSWSVTFEVSGDFPTKVTNLTLARATIVPGGQANMLIDLDFEEGCPSYPYVYEFSVAKVGVLPTSVPTTDSIPPEEIVASSTGTGEGNATATVSVPPNVDATADPTTHEGGVYEMQVSVTLGRAAGHEADNVVFLAGSQTTSPTGTSVPVNKRTVNGDLCVVPGGEDVRVHGYVDFDVGRRVYDWTGLFGGQFLDATGADTVADFTGRMINESIAINVDTCYAAATATNPATGNPYYNPMVIDCPNWAGWTGDSSWTVGKHSAACAAPQAGTWGTCCDKDTSLDAVGYMGACVFLYLEAYDAPVISDPNCYATGTQEMHITCRPDWLWAHMYKSTYGIGTMIAWEDPAGPLEHKQVQSARDSMLTSPRVYPTGAATCNDPP